MAVSRGLTNNCGKKRSEKKRKAIPSGMQSSKEQQEDIRKPSISDQCKEIEENTEWERLEIFKKIRDTEGIFHAKMGSIKGRYGLDLTEAEDIKKRWQEYTEELYKKDLQDPDNHNGVITHLKPDILECEVKWALESIIMNKASGSD